MATDEPVEMELDSSQVQVPSTPNISFSQPDSTQPDITPPSSVQLTHPAPAIARTPSPMPMLYSPPPTTKESQESLTTMAAASDIPSSSQIVNASVEELRQMVTGLSHSLREARTSAAHYNLQHNMLMIESSKANNALVVEIDMLQRELEVLQNGDGRRSASSPAHTVEAVANRDLITDLNRQISILNNEIQRQQVHMGHLQRTLDTRTNRNSILEEMNERLRHRIRTNREHYNGLMDSVRDRSPISALNTPARSYYTSPRGHLSTPGRRTGNRDTNNMAFDVLLLADKVISQETATAPSTPTPHSKRKGHTRGTLSMSSLPTTPKSRPLASSQE